MERKRLENAVDNVGTDRGTGTEDGYAEVSKERHCFSM